MRDLVNAYEPRPEDVIDERFGEVRQVVRRVSSTFWLLRDIQRYGSRCVVISPESLRDRVVQELRSLQELYSSTKL